MQLQLTGVDIGSDMALMLRSGCCTHTVHTVSTYHYQQIEKRYSSCRYNERQLIDVTVVGRVRPRAERTYVRIDFCRLIPGTYVSGT